MGVVAEMNRKPHQINAFAMLMIFVLLIPSTAMSQSDQPAQNRVDPISESDAAYRYRLFKTTNIWTFILLDTATGRAWQVQYSVDDTPTARAPINEHSLLPDSVIEKNGRFTLYPTQNMYNFLLLDREDSRIWQLQWSIKPEFRGIMRSIN